MGRLTAAAVAFKSRSSELMMTSPRRRAPSTTLASTMSLVRARPTRVPAALALASSRVSTSHPAKRRASCACRGVPRQHCATTGEGTVVLRGAAAGHDGGPTSAAHLVRRRSAPGVVGHSGQAVGLAPCGRTIRNLPVRAAPCLAARQAHPRPRPPRSRARRSRPAAPARRRCRAPGPRWSRCPAPRRCLPSSRRSSG
jgi:hypothetical protein